MASLEDKHNLAGECEDALNQKNNYSFKDLCSLAEKAGFEQRRQIRTGHNVVYKHRSHTHPTAGQYGLLSLQPDKKTHSKAKPYQVKQLVTFIREAKPKGKR